MEGQVTAKTLVCAILQKTTDRGARSDRQSIDSDRSL